MFCSLTSHLALVRRVPISVPRLLPYRSLSTESPKNLLATDKKLDNVPYMDNCMLMRSKSSQISRVLRKKRYQDENLLSVRYNVIGFTHRIMKSYNINQKPEKLNQDDLQTSSVDDNVEAALKVSSMNHHYYMANMLFGILYTLHFGLLAQYGHISKKDSLKQVQRLLTIQTGHGKSSKLSWIPTMLQHHKEIDINTSDLDSAVVTLTNLYVTGNITKYEEKQQGEQSIWVESTNVENISNNSPVLMEKEFSDILKELLIFFMKLNDLHYNKQYTLDDLTLWISSISKKTVKESWGVLQGQAVPPEFILLDVIFKNSATTKELNICVNIFKKFFKQFHQKTSTYVFFYLVGLYQMIDYTVVLPVVKTFLDKFQKISIPYNCQHPGYNDASYLLMNGLDWSYQNTRGSTQNQQDTIEIYVLNMMLWKLSDSSIRNRSKYYHLEMIRSQNFIIEFLSKTPKTYIHDYPDGSSTADDTIDTLQKNLNILGNLGLVNALVNISQPTARKSLDMVEAKYIRPFMENLSKWKDTTPLKELIKNDAGMKYKIYQLLSRFYYIKLRNCRNESELINVFNEVLNFNQYHKDLNWLPNPINRSALIWRGFIMKLEELRILTQPRVVALITKIINNEFGLKSANFQILELLMRKNNDYQVLQEFVNNLSSRGLMNSQITTGFIVKLYRHAINKKVHGLQNVSLELTGCDDILSYVRSIVNSMNELNVPIIGEVLYHEASIQPKNIYSLYTHYLKRNGDEKYSLSPNKSCIKSLLVAALKEKYLVWDNKYAVQIAIAEFKRWMTPSSSDKYITPDKTTWHLYLALLHDYNYQTELMDVIGLWEAMRYVPTKALLVKYLSLLPNDVSDRIIKFGQEAIMEERKNDENKLTLQNDDCGGFLEDFGFMENERSSNELPKDKIMPSPLDKHTQPIEYQRKRWCKEHDIYVPFNYDYSTKMWPWPSKKAVMNSKKSLRLVGLI
ncbi:hypothetical protein DASC09_002320 [Saccharomycopsis crataegensis]|uniref:Mitochondrial group I intron splicing factor CCM1 n=1 Tax=Saccharomycopsis crataegensis TaxID=43959 RepID=A0AAV5QDT2_9ASCO|nr:hypothetical protein DASC09_002320 [Saccharomycopsis crataegensis]